MSVTAGTKGDDGGGSAPRFGIRAFGVTRVEHDAVPSLKSQLGPPGQGPFPPSFLKPSEEQTVVALAAVLQAIDTHGLGQECFEHWGVVAAPCSMGRLVAAETLSKYRQGGAWKVAPLLVAHHSLHSISGTISQALGIHGPNFGVGGGPRAVAEGLVTAWTLLSEGRLPGLWLVLTQSDPEPMPDTEGHTLVPVTYHGVALALVPAAAPETGWQLHYHADAAQLSQSQAEVPTVRQLVQILSDKASSPPAACSCPLGWGAALELRRAA
ncbi:MAG: hypothetical protein ACK4RK_00230 [Gemmataceae bacterium]